MHHRGRGGEREGVQNFKLMHPEPFTQEIPRPLYFDRGTSPSIERAESKSHAIAIVALFHLSRDRSLVAFSPLSGKSRAAAAAARHSEDEAGRAAPSPPILHQPSRSVGRSLGTRILIPLLLLPAPKKGRASSAPDFPRQRRARTHSLTPAAAPSLPPAPLFIDLTSSSSSSSSSPRDIPELPPPPLSSFLLRHPATENEE